MPEIIGVFVARTAPAPDPAPAPAPQLAAAERRRATQNNEAAKPAGKQLASAEANRETPARKNRADSELPPPSAQPKAERADSKNSGFSANVSLGRG